MIINGKKKFSLLVWVTAILLLTFSTWLWIMTNEIVEREQETKLYSLTVNIADDISDQINSLNGALMDLNAHFTGLEINQKNFDDYVKASKLNERFPAIMGFAYAKARFEPTATTDASTDANPFSVRVSYIYPHDWRNKKAFGFDMYSEKNRRQAIDRSIFYNQSSLSGALTLAQINEQGFNIPGVIIYLPHFKNVDVSKTVNRTPQNVKGLFYVIIDTDDFFKSLLGEEDWQKARMNYRIYSYKVNEEGQFESVYKRFKNLPLDENKYTLTKSLDLLQNKYIIRSQPMPHILSSFENRAPEFVLAASILTSLLICGFMYFTYRSLLKESQHAQISRDLAEKADAANKAKSSFLANMSHEIRTPLGAIMGYSELIASGKLSPEKRQEFVVNIKKNGENLTQLLEDILDTARIEAGKLLINSEPMELKALLKELDTTFRHKTAAKNIYFKLTFVSDVPDHVVVDELRLKQILTNLINNAIRFTHIGGVELKVGITSSIKPMLYFEVEDTGIGLPKNSQSFLFTKFGQGDVSSTRSYGGTGLGLALSKRLAHLLKGDVFLLRSEPNVGTTFRLEVPLIATQAPIKVSDISKYLSQDKEDFSDMKILLVEDSIDNQEIFRHFLEDTKAQLKIVSDGSHAFEEGRKAEYNIILMDIQIPVMDGKQVTQLLREAHVKTPIVALTAHAQKEEVEACRQAGCNGHIAKPVSRQKLIQAIEKYANI